MSLPTSKNMPWNEENVTIRTSNGYVMNPKQVEYFRQLNKSLNAMYSDIANAVNILCGALSLSGSQQYLKLKADDGTYIYIYPKKDGVGYTITSTPEAP